MKLVETVNLMCSHDFKDRFIAEYVQLVIRLSKLDAALNNPSAARFEIDDIARDLMLKQRDAMESYKVCLEKRADTLGIDLSNYSM